MNDLKYNIMKISSNYSRRTILVTFLILFIGVVSSYAQFSMGNTLAPLPGNPYPIIYANDAKGGHHQVANIAARNAITSLRRIQGMLCTVLDAGSGTPKTYQLLGGILDANWVEFTSGNAGTVTTNANLTGPITSVGNATSVASQTGTGSTFVMNTSPVLVSPNLGTPTALIGTNITGTAAGLNIGGTWQGLNPSSLWNNTGNNHGTFSSFSGPTNFGRYFIHQDVAVTDGPGPQVQFYSESIGLGNEYPYSQFGMQTAIQRNTANPYMFIRYEENSSWLAWTKLAAGYADNAGTATTFSTVRTSYKGITDGAVAGQLMWKNYGNNHTVFDASAGTAPDGTAHNNSVPENAWSATFPTLMGFNGVATYGVKVNRADLADVATNWSGSSAYLPLAGGTMTGQLNSQGNQASGIGTATGGLGAIMVQGNGTNAAFMCFHRPGNYASYFGLDSDNQWKVGGWSAGAVAYTIWHSGNLTKLSQLTNDLGITAGWGLTGNTGTTAGTNFIGTTDDKDVVFKRNGGQAGSLSAWNTSWGVQALNPLNGGVLNSAIGTASLSTNTSGNLNTAVGSYASQLNTTGSNNTAIGASSLSKNQTGSNNVAIGTLSLQFNNSGSSGVAIGNSSQQNSNSTVTAWTNTNTSVGSQSLMGSATPANNTGLGNTGVGYQSMLNISSGINNSSLGLASLYSNTSGSFNVAIGNISGWSISTGSSNTAVGNNSLHDTSTGSWNIGIGEATLNTNQGGSYGIAIGEASQQYANNTGTIYTNSNISIGYQSLKGGGSPAFNTGVANTVIGFQSMQNNSSGNNNVATGNQALYTNTTGNFNTAIGSLSLYSNTTGTNNIAIGYNALYSCTGTSSNIATGHYALYFNTGSNNIAYGGYALYNNTGNFNIASGIQAMMNNTTGNNNTAYGYTAGKNITTGSNNTAIGNNAQVPTATASNQVKIGDTSISYAGIQVAWTITSDKRWKDKIIDLPYGLNMVSKLRPVDYVRKNNEANTHEIGFIAQEVEKVLIDLGYNTQGMLTKDDKGYFSLRYNDFIPVLTKAIQEQQAQIETLKLKADKVDDLQKQIDELKELIKKLNIH